MRTILHRHHVGLATVSPKLKTDSSERFREVLTLFDSTQQWPSEDDAIHGKTMKIVNERLPKRKFVGGFTYDICNLFKSRGYKGPDSYTRPIDVQRLINTLNQGVKDPALAKKVRELCVGNKISKGDIALLKSMNFNF